MLAANDPQTSLDDEQRQVDLWRYQEAYDAGFSHDQASAFAFSGTDVGQLRRLLRDGCPLDLAARIVA